MTRPPGGFSKPKPKVVTVPASCRAHPKYTAFAGKPPENCPTCWLIYTSRLKKHKGGS